MIEYKCPQCGYINKLCGSHFFYTDVVECEACFFVSMESKSRLNESEEGEDNELRSV